MKRVVFLFALMLASAAFSLNARAEPVPEYALDKDYQNCMGGETDQQDPPRADYCNCVRNAMRDWSLDDYGAVAGQAKAGGGQTPQKLEDVAKTCIAKALK